MAIGKTFGFEEYKTGITLPDISSQKADVTGLNLSAMLKVPNREGYTVSLMGGYSYAKTEWPKGSLLSESESEIDFKTYNIGVAVTFYFGPSVNK